MATNISDLKNKIENDGANSQGKLSAEEFNRLVQAVIENQSAVLELTPEVSSKIGYLYRTPQIGSDNLYHVYGFKNKDDFELWLENEDATLIVADISIPKQDATATSYVLNLVNGSGNTIISTDNSVKVKLRFTSTLYNPVDASQTDTNETGVLSIYTRLNENYDWVKKGEMNINSLSKDSTSFTEIDITEMCATGTQQVRLMVRGKDTQMSTTAVVISVTKTQFKLTFASQWESPITSAMLPLAYYIEGSVAGKKLNLRIDGKRNAVYDIGEPTYIQTPYPVTIQDVEGEINPVCTQGVHSIEAWLSVEAEGKTIESAHITNEVLVILDEDTAQDYVMVQDMNTSLVNWTNQLLFRYAVYSAESNYLDISFKLYDYNRTKLYAEFNMGEIQEGKQFSFENMIEIEEVSTSFTARIDIVNNADGSTLRNLVFGVDNSQNFSPTAGADFILNPKLRTNEESDPERIINNANGEPISSIFRNFGFKNDGWTTDENGIKCLRVLAGSSLDIDYESFSGFTTNNNTNSLTIEFDIATRNIVNEQEAIIKMCTYSAVDATKFYGLEFKPLEACFMTANKQVKLDQDIMWEEGRRTHIAVNIVYNLANSGINYIRIFVNGCINREIDYVASDTFLQLVNGVRTSQGIRIGASQAEIDIYGIRVYKKALSSSDVMQDYVASLSTSDEKLTFRANNDILVNGLINYEKTKEMYNTMLWKPNARTEGTCRLATYGDAKDQLQYGDMDVIIVGDKAHSGSFYNMNTKGQGTSSMSYWKWNQRIQFDDDGYFVNENGETFEGKYQLEDGVPFATRLDGKINWASSMQSHKIGATALYHDVWKKLIGGNDITKTEGGQDFTNTEGGYADCRVAVKQKPFFMFVQETPTSEPVFYGLYTWGAGKGDKPTFGYDKSKFPDFTVLEGCDNNMPLVMHRVPWDSAIEGNIITDEKVKYNGKDNWELSMGSGKLWEHFKTAFNFVYLLHNDIHPYIGTFSAMIVDKTISKDKDYWVTASDASANKFDLFRFDEATEQWVKAGIEKATLNVNTQCGNIVSDSEVDWDAINQRFINKRVEMFANGLETYFDKADLMYTMRFNRILCASDNRGKNTYLYKVNASSKIMFLQDDLDTIFLNNNVGKKTKPYYLEEFDKNESGEYYWTSTRNALYNLMELAFPSELRTTTYSILSAMASLGGGTLEGCFQKYFLSVQEYFPVTAYNEVSRLLYEDAAIALKEGRYTTNTLPLPQSLGNLLEAERSWITRRLAYMSSYASYGKYDSGEQAGALSFRSIVTTTGDSPTYNFTLQPHTWLYPSIGIGDSAIWSGVRVKAGDVFNFPTQKSDGNTNIRILDINSYRYIGEWGDKSVGEGFLLAGTRLTEFVASAIPQEFRPTSMQITALNLTKLDLNGVHTLVGALDLSKLTALEYVDLRGTSLTSITLPTSNALKKLYLPATLTSLRIDNQPNLEEVVIEGYDQLAEVYVDAKRAGSLNTQTIALNIYNAAKAYDDAHKGEPSRQVVTTFLNVDWASFDINAFMWFTEQKSATLTGKVKIYEGSSYVYNVTFDIKNKINIRWGNVDDATSEDHKGLLLEYVIRNLGTGGSSIKGNFFNNGNPTHEFYIQPSNVTANDFSKIYWEITKQGAVVRCSINEKTGLLTVDLSTLPMTEDSIVISATIYKLDGTSESLTRSVSVYNRQAQLGDFVLYDGSYCDPDEWDGEKTVVGVCFYLAPRDTEGNIIAEYFNPNDKHTRLMVALNYISMTDTTGTYYNAIFGLGSNSHKINNKSLSLADGSLTTTTIYDIPTITNKAFQFSYFNTENVRDINNIENYGFKGLSPVYIEGDGLAYQEPADYVAQRTLTEEYMHLVGEGNYYKVGDIVNNGYMSTLKIIAHRNKIINGQILPLEETTTNEDGSTSQLTLPLSVPQATGNTTELEDLLAGIRKATKFMKDQFGLTVNAWGACFYFPAASMCYAYEPKLKTGEVLIDKFKAHNWFLPPLGLCGYIQWYRNSGSANNAGIFEKAKEKLNFFGSIAIMSSTERSGNDIWKIDPNGFIGNDTNKISGRYILPICAF